ncbi:prepilin-type N-terminal cleavage/methylation domain-containing protein [Candidatus Uhrbacteria bacterium]|nr:prepilin-type N-terminal cleavage/methylation domain-containing protein [Candidatus Uhrbacteria bacterium]
MNPRGFTLLELLTVMGVFSLLSILIVAIHQQVSLLQRRTQGENKVISEARYALEAMATALRVGTVYYAGYANGSSPTFTASNCGLNAQPNGVLYLIDEDKERVRYVFQRPCSIGVNNGCIVKTFYGSIASVRDSSTPNPVPSARVTAEDLDIQSFAVNVRPLCNPYNKTCMNDGANIRQPFVTLTLGVLVPKQGGARMEYIQTSTSSRVYHKIVDANNIDLVCTPMPP